MNSIKDKKDVWKKAELLRRTADTLHLLSQNNEMKLIVIYNLLLRNLMN